MSLQIFETLINWRSNSIKLDAPANGRLNNITLLYWFLLYVIHNDIRLNVRENRSK